MSKDELYARLELERGATTAEIKAAYRRLIRLCHPDHNDNNQAAADATARLNEAYRVLMNDDDRKAYDNGEALGKLNAFDNLARDIFLTEFGDAIKGGATSKILMVMDNTMASKINKYAANVREGDAHEVKLIKIMRSITVKEGENLLAGMLTEELKELREITAELTEKIKALKRAREFIKNYEEHGPDLALGGGRYALSQGVTLPPTRIK